MQIGFIVILIIAIFVAIFAIQNGTPVPVDLFFARYEMPLAVIMMACLILGAVIILILGTTRQFKKRSEQKELKNKIKAFETEKAQSEINIKAIESEKQNLTNTNAELSTKVTELSTKVAQLNDKIKLQEKEFNAKVQELETLKTQTSSEIENVTEIIDEGVAQISDENSEVESQ
ncbi:MAG: DUF1049 domain-containing protein [Tissierellia bacterium]|mgnify:CR=1 FL=1|jgi:uncharacterized integral membrane protein/outer membrane murein-binding lipoprotein Lpp|nr:DUF1049 domain-containing protein [Tissierellia bacterium]HKM00616.1 lipopolysaccharide assembly protein LapA domain-containing protein [Sedimentibacter sp.]